jgi:hypothetical protein
VDNDENSLSFGCDGELCWRGAAGRLHLLQAQQQQLFGHDDSSSIPNLLLNFYSCISDCNLIHSHLRIWKLAFYEHNPRIRIKLHCTRREYTNLCSFLLTICLMMTTSGDHQTLTRLKQQEKPWIPNAPTYPT